MPGPEWLSRAPENGVECSPRVPEPALGPRVGPGAALDARAVVALQRSAGNQAVARLVSAGSVPRPAGAMVQRARIDIPLGPGPAPTIDTTQMDEAGLRDLRASLSEEWQRLEAEGDFMRQVDVESAIASLDQALAAGDYRQNLKRRGTDDATGEQPAQKRPRTEPGQAQPFASPQPVRVPQPFPVPQPVLTGLPPAVAHHQAAFEAPALFGDPFASDDPGSFLELLLFEDEGIPQYDDSALMADTPPPSTAQHVPSFEAPPSSDVPFTFDPSGLFDELGFEDEGTLQYDDAALMADTPPPTSPQPPTSAQLLWGDDVPSAPQISSPPPISTSQFHFSLGPPSLPQIPSLPQPVSPPMPGFRGPVPQIPSTSQVIPLPQVPSTSPVGFPPFLYGGPATSAPSMPRPVTPPMPGFRGPMPQVPSISPVGVPPFLYGGPVTPRPWIPPWSPSGPAPQLYGGPAPLVSPITSWPLPGSALQFPLGGTGTSAPQGPASTPKSKPRTGTGRGRTKSQFPSSAQIPSAPKKTRKGTGQGKKKSAKSTVGADDESGKAKAKLADDDFKQAWPETGPEDFYNTLRKHLEENAKGSKSARAALDSLLTGMQKTKHNRAWILDKIRVDATPSPGAKFGSGLDELFQTASTAEWISRSAGDVRCRPHSLYRGKPFDWVRAQEMVRVRTESVVWFASDLLEGHSGAVTTAKDSGWHTKGQALFHKLRDDAQRQSSTPRNAVLRSIALMLRLTANVAQWSDPKSMFQGQSAGGHDFTDAAQRALAWSTLVAYRDKLKRVYNDLYANTSEDPTLEGPPPATDTAPAVLDQETAAIEQGGTGTAAAGGFTEATSGQRRYWAPASPVQYEPPSPFNDPNAPFDEPQDFAQVGAVSKGSLPWATQ